MIVICKEPPKKNTIFKRNSRSGHRPLAVSLLGWFFFCFLFFSFAVPSSSGPLATSPRSSPSTSMELARYGPDRQQLTVVRGVSIFYVLVHVSFHFFARIRRRRFVRIPLRHRNFNGFGCPFLLLLLLLLLLLMYFFFTLFLFCFLSSFVCGYIFFSTYLTGLPPKGPVVLPSRRR